MTAALAALTTPAAGPALARMGTAPVASRPGHRVDGGRRPPVALAEVRARGRRAAAGVCWTARRRTVVAVAAGAAVVMAMVAALVVHHRLHGGWISFPDAAGPLVAGGRHDGGPIEPGDPGAESPLGRVAGRRRLRTRGLGARLAVRAPRRRGRGELAAPPGPVRIGAVRRPGRGGGVAARRADRRMAGGRVRGPDDARLVGPGRQVVVVAPARRAARGLDRSKRGPSLRAPFLVAAAVLGVATWSWTTIEAVTRAPHAGAWTSSATTNPWYRLWRLVLPDGRSPGLGDEVLPAGGAAPRRDRRGRARGRSCSPRRARDPTAGPRHRRSDGRRCLSSDRAGWRARYPLVGAFPGVVRLGYSHCVCRCGYGEVGE